MKKLIGVNLYLICFLFVYACQNEKKTPLATVYGNNLYIENIAGYFDHEMSKEDSLKLLKQIVDEWVLNQIKLKYAKDFASAEIEQMANEYKNNLMIAAFFNQYIQNNLDTVITEKEMLAYFNQNKQNFLLSKNFLKLIFVKIDANNKNLAKIKKLLIKADESDIQKLSAWCDVNASNYFLDYNVWLDFDDVLKEIPIKTYDVEQFLQNNQYFEIKDGNEMYLVRIIDYKIRNTESEFEFEKDNIKKVLLNSRKNNLIKKFEKDLLEEAKNSDKVEVFIND